MAPSPPSVIKKLENEMIVTQDWLNEISDEKGLTKGQLYLLKKWCKGDDHINKEIPDLVGHFLLMCRGYREIPQHVKDFKGWV